MQSPVLRVSSLLLLLLLLLLPLSLLPSLPAFPANLDFLDFTSQACSLSLSPFFLFPLCLFFLYLSLPLSLLPTNKQVSRALLFHPRLQRGHRPVWPLRRPEAHRDWLRRGGNCSERSREWQTGIARQKHRASCQLLSPKGRGLEMENAGWVPGWLLDKSAWRVFTATHCTSVPNAHCHHMLDP